MILADKIIHLRKKNGWSQEQLAHELGISRQSVSKWESGMSIPDLDKIIKLSALFGVSTDYLLKDEMNAETPSETTDMDDFSIRTVDAEEANTYMNLVESISKVMASAIALFILSPIPLLLLGAMAEYSNKISESMAAGLGIGILLFMVIIGVVLLILNGMKLSKYEYLEEDEISLQYGVQGIVEKKKLAFEQTFRTSIALGVALCIGGVIPLVVAGGIHASDFICICMVCVLLLCIAIGVFFFVHAGMIQGSYQKLLQEGDYSITEKEDNKKLSFFPGVYWCIITAIYLGISFSNNSWDTSWIVWPVAGVAFAAIMGILKFIVRKRA